MPPAPVLPRLPVHPERIAQIAASVPAGVRNAMLTHPEMRRRLLARYFARMGVAEPDPKTLWADSRRILAAITSGRERFCGLAGLVWYAHALSRAITPSAVRPLLAAFTPNDIALAVSMKLFAPLSEETPPPSAEDMKAAGEQLARAGAKAWGDGFARLVEVLLPPQAVQPGAALTDPAAILLGALAYRLQPPSAAPPSRAGPPPVPAMART